MQKTTKKIVEYSLDNYPDYLLTLERTNYKHKAYTECFYEIYIQNKNSIHKVMVDSYIWGEYSRSNEYLVSEVVLEDISYNIDKYIQKYNNYNPNKKEEE